MLTDAQAMAHPGMVSEVAPVPTVHPAASLVQAKLAPQTMKPEQILALQRALGNRQLREHLETWRGSTSGSADAIRRTADAGVQSPSTTLPYLEQIQKSFGRHDISGTQAHLGPEAASSARSLEARAYATGNHVVFEGPPDLHTTAHEAAHIVQQRSGVQLAGGIGQAGDAYEQHADAVANKVVTGQSAEALLGRPPGKPSGAPGLQAVPSSSAPVQLLPYDVLHAGRYYLVELDEGRREILYLQQKSKYQGKSFKFRSELSDRSATVTITNEDKIIQEVNPEEIPKIKNEAAKLHLGHVAKIFGDFADETGAVLRGIPGGGAFTNKRSASGELRIQEEVVDKEVQRPLSSTEIAELFKRTELFNKFTNELRSQVRQTGPIIRFPIYRAVRVVNKESLKVGGTLKDIIPSSSSFSQEFGLKWGAGANKVLLKISVPIDFRVLFFSYPHEAERSQEAPIARNQEQQEVIIGPAEYRIDAINYVQDRLVLHVTPRELRDDELAQAFEVAHEARSKAEAEERVQAKAPSAFELNQSVGFSLDPDESSVPQLVDYFTDAQIETIKGLKKGGMVQDKDGRTWVVDDEMGEYYEQFQTCELKLIKLAG